MKGTHVRAPSAVSKVRRVSYSRNKQACRDAVVVYSLFFSPATYIKQLDYELEISMA